MVVEERIPKLVWVEETQAKVFSPAAQFLETLPDDARDTLTAQLAQKTVVQISPEAYDDAMVHVTGHRIERVGLLLGEVYEAAAKERAATPSQRSDEATTRYLIRITEAVGCTDDSATSVSVNIHPSAWLAIQPQLDAGKVVIGWFHSHPNLGAFFSGTDRATQRNIFGEAYTVGWVIDWVRNEQKWYVGKNSTEQI
jgi:proteasome lid subunit RPN8/RPN11